MKRVSSGRRRLLQGGLGSLLLPGWAWAQSEGAAKLLRRPKRALVIGNAAYRNVPVLKNPESDARAIGATLAECGFRVETVIDADRPRMAEAIQAHVAAVNAQKCVGLFYFAGHGVQLAWRNFLLPVDATVRVIGDIPAQCVDASGLIAGLTRARNPMNVIILDACRENPFGDFRVEQQGLSQMDAPPSTLLAYATAPGNLAADGAGANGLYTECLLREMKVREAKIEDVFKRVRLAVRRTSRGAQIPWESTSLEEDFYFLPPESLRKLSQEEEEREFEEELALFERARTATAPAPLEEYLRRHPSGRFAELAQFRLDAVLAAQGEKRIEVASSAGNPLTAGTARSDTRFRVGDSYSYRSTGTKPNDEPRGDYTLTVTAIGEGEVAFNNGEFILDLLGNTIQPRNGRRFTPRQDQPLEFAVGRRWSTRFTQTKGGKLWGHTALDFRITTRESVTVPAGSFNCFRVEVSGQHHRRGKPPVDISTIYWADPDRVRRAVARERENRTVERGHVKRIFADRDELVSFRQG